MKQRTEINDISWDKVEETITNREMSAKQLREKYAPDISPVTFRKWTERTVGRKFRIDWGTQGRYNRVQPKAKSSAATVPPPLPLTTTMRKLVTDHGFPVVLRTMAKLHR